MRRKGFTLVELLIVIVVIGVLSTMMMLSSTEAVTSAKASNIISNMRNLKTAALAYYVDNLNTAESLTAEDALNGDEKYKIFKYMTNGEAITANNYATSPFNGYNFKISNGHWYVEYVGSDLGERVNAKLEARRSSVGISSAKETTATTQINNDTKNIYMLIR